MNTNATNKTQFFGLPLFTADDKPSIITDWNETMEALDNILEEYKEIATGAKDSSDGFLQQVKVVEERFEELKNQLSDDENVIKGNTEQIQELTEKLIEVDTAIKSVMTNYATNASVDDKINNAINEVSKTFKNITDSINEDVQTNYNYLGKLQDIFFAVSRLISNEYDTYKTYNKDDVVFENTFVSVNGNLTLLPKFYQCLQNNTYHIETADTDYWKEITRLQPSSFNGSLQSQINEIDDVLFSDYKIGKAYKSSDILIYDGFYYMVNEDISISDNTSFEAVSNKLKKWDEIDENRKYPLSEKVAELIDQTLRLYGVCNKNSVEINQIFNNTAVTYSESSTYNRGDIVKYRTGGNGTIGNPYVYQLYKAVRNNVASIPGSDPYDWQEYYGHWLTDIENLKNDQSNEPTYYTDSYAIFGGYNDYNNGRQYEFDSINKALVYGMDVRFYNPKDTIDVGSSFTVYFRNDLNTTFRRQLRCVNKSSDSTFFHLLIEGPAVPIYNNTDIFYVAIPLDSLLIGMESSTSSSTPSALLYVK